MKKEEIITLIIIFLVIIMEIACQNYIGNMISKTTEELSSLKQNLINEKEDDYENKIKSINEEWNNKSQIISFFVRYDEIDKINLCMKKTQTKIEIKSNEDAISEIEESIHTLNFLKEINKFNLKNIL